MTSTRSLQLVMRLLGMRDVLALRVHIDGGLRFGLQDYAELDEFLGRFVTKKQERHSRVLTTVYEIRPRQLLVVIRDADGPVFGFKRTLLTTPYIGVLSDAVRKTVDLASDRFGKGTAVIEASTRESTAVVGVVRLRTKRSERATLAFSMAAPSAKDFETWLSRDELTHLQLKGAIGLLRAPARSGAPIKHADLSGGVGGGVWGAHGSLRSGVGVTARQRESLRLAFQILRRTARGPTDFARSRVSRYIPHREVAEPEVVEIFYATDRKRTGSRRPSGFYGSQPAEALTFGTCQVSIPPTHTIGVVESPTIWKLEFRSDPQKHVVLLDVRSTNEATFYDRLNSTVGTYRRRQAFIFVHGFNVTFEDAAKRTAQIHRDLKFAGAPILYSWPSRGSVKDYQPDEARVDPTKYRLKTFLLQLWRRVRLDEIHIIAHSMGNRAVTGALELLRLDAGVSPKPPLKQIILAAPDLDAETFKLVVRQFKGLGRRVTLYGSSKDKAIRASKLFHRAPRAGDGGRNLCIVTGVDSIDASAVETDFLSHSYIADSSSLLSDMNDLVSQNKAPAKRFGISPRDGGGWHFLPRR